MGSGLIHVDRLSVGLYTYPLQVINVSGAPWDGGVWEGRLLAKSKWMRGEQLLHESVAMNHRIAPGHVPLESVYSWLSLTPHVAVPVFLQALPRYWMSRFRKSRATKGFFDGGSESVEIERLLSDRTSDRLSLVEHRTSLESKLWAIHYHRCRFQEEIKGAKADSKNKVGHLVAASAEVAAHDAMIYAFLDEMAVVIALMNKIAKGIDLPRSFSELCKRLRSDEGIDDLAGAISLGCH